MGCSQDFHSNQATESRDATLSSGSSNSVMAGHASLGGFSHVHVSVICDKLGSHK